MDAPAVALRNDLAQRIALDVVRFHSGCEDLALEELLAEWGADLQAAEDTSVQWSARCLRVSEWWSGLLEASGEAARLLEVLSRRGDITSAEGRDLLAGASAVLAAGAVAPDGSPCQ